jgi:hypothetical protein
MNRQILFIVGTFVIGFGLGFLLKSALPQPRSKIDEEWHQQFSEDMDHQRIMEFQKALQALRAKSAADATELSKQLDMQLQIEDLVVKSREAEYAKFTPFTPLFAGGFGVGGILGLVAGIFTRKRGPIRLNDLGPT